MIGWDEQNTVQYEGIVDGLRGAGLDRLQKAYFSVYPDGPARLAWKGITYFRVRPVWARYSDFNSPGEIVEFTERELNV